jgi:hypothetical protein
MSVEAKAKRAVALETLVSQTAEFTALYNKVAALASGTLHNGVLTMCVTEAELPCLQASMIIALQQRNECVKVINEEIQREQAATPEVQGQGTVRSG